MSSSASPLVHGANAQPAAAPDESLAGEAKSRRVVAHLGQKTQLVFLGRLEGFASLEDLEATSGAHRAAAREGQGRFVFVADVGEAGPRRGIDGD